ncbi:MAG TPA: homoserine kinase [Thermoflexales bacterium]|nr:homoserine kinase [Thermoflexales bacterium]HQX11489.1 homoserine kinase [Thermoflexales bacterium]HQY26806.1 homoserine kinase [Thermoflexales bacterium]HQZ54230.1 homoserine kinase [Thermoflexales bacterium]HRA53990.1 homoserine kinase [Thermoflexales bacterium]
MSRSLRARVPATSANLGPGFDCMGIALDLWNDFTLSAAPGDGITVTVEGEGAGVIPLDASNIVAETLAGEWARLGRADLLPGPGRGYALACRNRVPCGSGLGSSSTAILGGLLLAHGWAADAFDLEDAQASILARAVEIEGHGDNVAPALLGGLIVVTNQDGEVLTDRLPIAPMRVAVCVPDFAFSTSEARAALPKMYTRADAIYNIGRAMLVIEALRNHDDALLARAMGDRIHEPYRVPRIPGAAAARLAALDAGAIAVSLSGAGPGLLAFARAGHEAIGAAMVAAFAAAGLPARAWALEISPAGSSVEGTP